MFELLGVLGVWYPHFLSWPPLLHMNKIWPRTFKHPSHTNSWAGATWPLLHLVQFGQCKRVQWVYSFDGTSVYIIQRGISIFDWYSTSEQIISDESITYNQKQDCNCWKFGKHRRHSDLANNSTFTSHASVTLVHHRISTRSCQTPYRGQHSISIISTIPSKVHIHFYSTLD